MKDLNFSARIIAALAAGTMLCAAGAWAQGTPSVLPPATFIGNGGHSVAGDGRWVAVMEQSKCRVQILELDYPSMTWSVFDNITAVVNPPCSNGEYGTSAAMAGDLVVVGIPGWDGQGIQPPPNTLNFGGFAIYRFDGIGWDPVLGLNSSFGRVQQPPVLIEGTRMGTSVAIARSPSEPDNYLIVAGAPGPLDVNLNPVTGRVYFYRYNANNSPALVLIGEELASSALTRLGQSVAADFPFALVGEPDYNSNEGRARLFNLDSDANGIPDTAHVLVQDLSTGTGGDRLGEGVSLGPEFVQGLGVSASFAFENTGTALARTYVPRAGTFTNLGGVSQDAGISAYGKIGATKGADIYRDPVTDTIPGQAVTADVSTDFAGDVLTDVGLNLRLLDEYLWFANPGTDRVIRYHYPCGYGFKRVAFEFDLISLPCDITGLTVQQVFGALGTYDVNYRMWEVLDSRVAEASPTRRLAATDPLTQDRGYWLQTDSSGYFAIPNAVSEIVTVSEAPPAGLPDRVRAVRRMELPDALVPSGGGTAFGRVIVGNPFSRPFRVEDLRYTDPATGNLKTLVVADTDNQVLGTVYIYDPEFMAGQIYRALSATPGLSDMVPAQQAFWVRIEEDGIQSDPNGHQLYIPQNE